MPEQQFELMKHVLPTDWHWAIERDVTLTSPSASKTTLQRKLPVPAECFMVLSWLQTCTEARHRLRSSASGMVASFGNVRADAVILLRKPEQAQPPRTEGDVGAHKTKEKGFTNISIGSLYLFNAGNDRSLPRAKSKGCHTFACSTIGPAALNLRRLEGVSARPLRAGAFCRNPERSVRRISEYNGMSVDEFRRIQCLIQEVAVAVLALRALGILFLRHMPISG
jgi:hypothetical protein